MQDLTPSSVRKIAPAPAPHLPIFARKSTSGFMSLFKPKQPAILALLLLASALLLPACSDPDSSTSRGAAANWVAAADRTVTVDRGVYDGSISPDGSTIAFGLLGKIWLLPASGGDARQLRYVDSRIVARSLALRIVGHWRQVRVMRRLVVWPVEANLVEG